MISVELKLQHHIEAFFIKIDVHFFNISKKMI